MNFGPRRDRDEAMPASDQNLAEDDVLHQRPSCPASPMGPRRLSRGPNDRRPLTGPPGSTRSRTSMPPEASAARCTSPASPWPWTWSPSSPAATSTCRSRACDTHLAMELRTVGHSAISPSTLNWRRSVPLARSRVQERLASISGSRCSNRSRRQPRQGARSPHPARKPHLPRPSTSDWTGTPAARRPNGRERIHGLCAWRS